MGRNIELQHQRADEDSWNPRMVMSCINCKTRCDTHGDWLVASVYDSQDSCSVCSDCV